MEPRPNAPKVLGILSIVFGAIGALFTLLGALGTATGAFQKMAGEGAQAAMASYMAKLQPLSTVITIVMGLMSVALILIGTGQLRYRRWATSASVQWAIVGLAVLIGQVIWQVLVVGPALETYLDDLGIGRAAREMGFGKAMALVALAFYAPYPIVLIAYFKKPRIVEAMTT